MREILGGSKDPDFEIKMLPGWERRTPDDDDKLRLESALKHRLMGIHRPDLYAVVQAMVEESYHQMQEQGAVAFYAATGDSDDTVIIPGSIVVSVRRSQDGRTLDSLVQEAIRDFGAEPLYGDVRIMRFEREKVVRLDDSDISQTSLIYLTPVPGSGRRRALQFTATFGRPLEMPPDHPRVQSWKFAFDACVSSLRWIRPTS